jgi:hypothetical protein
MHHEIFVNSASISKLSIRVKQLNTYIHEPKKDSFTEKYCYMKISPQKMYIGYLSHYNPKFL